MKIPFPAALAVVLLLSACGYKGSLYLPKEDDKAKFGVIQTGLDIDSRPVTAQPEGQP
ncbi:MAG: lipoprotein [Neisseria sp.]|nr:lipoprotein [Neisseria sp.]